MDLKKDVTAEMRDFFNAHAETWDKNCRHSAEKIAAIVTLAGVAAGSRIADIGCGTGVLFPEILSRNPAYLEGIDLSEQMIRKAREKFSDPRLHLTASDCFRFRGTGFDAVLIYSAYPHFPDKARLAAQTARMLKPGGRLMVAHSESRAVINGRHTANAVSHLSWELRPVEEEASEFRDLFRIDMQADTDDIYFFSGTRK